MKKLTLLIFIGILILASCNSNRVDLYEGISVSIPKSLKKEVDRENSFVNPENKVALKFSQSRNMSFGEFLPKVDFDFLYLSLSQDSILKIQNKEIRNILGMKVGVIEKSSDTLDMKIFFTEINHEFLLGVLSGNTANDKYMKSAFDEILESLREEN